MAASGRPHPAKPMLRIGHVAGAHGLRGALRVHLDDRGSRSLEQVKRMFIEQGGAVREIAIAAATHLNATTMRVVIEGIADATAADALKGATVSIAADDLPARRPGEFYYYEAIGCEVLLANGDRIGTIEDIFSNGAHEVLVVRSNGREVLVPVIEDIVKAMDFDARRVTITPVPGLLD
ncbi:MAG TPA: ribosome maturation factor RimM [Candidatus Binataceae bacterium]|nr:ribosome maturation factor RimM [Candidatus Binataceae bacterium]